MPLPRALVPFITDAKLPPDTAASLSELLRANDQNQSPNRHQQLILSTASFITTNPTVFDPYIKKIRETQWSDSAPSDIPSINAMIDDYGLGFVFCALFCTNYLCLNVSFPGCFETRTLRVSAAYTTSINQLVLLPHNTLNQPSVAAYISACRHTAGTTNRTCLAKCCATVLSSISAYSDTDQAIIKAAYECPNTPKSILYKSVVVAPAATAPKQPATKSLKAKKPSKPSAAAAAADDLGTDDADSSDESTQIPHRIAVELLNTIDQLDVFARVESIISTHHLDELVVQAINIFAAPAPPKPSNLRDRANATLARLSGHLREKRKYIADSTGIQTDLNAVDLVTLTLEITRKRATDAATIRSAAVNAAFDPTMVDHNHGAISNFEFA